MELNLASDVKGNKKTFYRDAGDKGKTRENVALSRRKRETWLVRTWRRLRSSRAFLPWSLLASAPAMLFKYQKAKEGTGRMKNHQLWKKALRFETV